MTEAGTPEGTAQELDETRPFLFDEIDREHVELVWRRDNRCIVNALAVIDYR